MMAARISPGTAKRPRHPMRQLIARMLAAGLVLSVLFGGAAYLYQHQRLSNELVEVAVSEAKLVAGARSERLREIIAEPSRAQSILRRFLTQRSDSAAGHFVRARLFDAAGAVIADALPAGEAGPDVAFELPSQPEHIPWHKTLDLSGELFLQVAVPLHAGETLAGFFVGLYHVSPAQVSRMRAEVSGTVAVVALVVAATALFLTPLVASLNARIVQLLRQALDAQLQTLGLVSEAIAKRDGDTRAHCRRVTLYAVHMASELGLSSTQLHDLIMGAFLHDVGKIAIPDAILLKPGKLTDQEFAVMKTHVLHGTEIVRRSDALRGAECIVRHHHERYDGTGYPDALKGDGIPIGARLFAVADVFDSLTSTRPYKAAMNCEEAMRLIEDGSGKQFDPVIVACFRRLAGRLHERISKASDRDLERQLQAVLASLYGLKAKGGALPAPP